MFSLRNIIDSEKEIYIYGDGLASVKCTYYLHNLGGSVCAYIVTNSSRHSFWDKPVVSISDYKCDKGFIIVAVSISSYKTIKRQLEQQGYVEFIDFIYWEWCQKKLCILHGNCHMAVIKSFLNSCANFFNNYCIYDNPPIYEMAEEKFSKEALENCDLFIHQDIRTDNRYGVELSDEYILKKIKCKEITVPNLFGYGRIYYPQFKVNSNNQAIANGADKNGMFPHADTVIDSLSEKKYDVDSIIEICESKRAFSEDFIISNFKEYMEIIRNRDEDWDVKVYDYILENYRNTLLFYDVGHPTNEVLQFISYGILDRLGIDYSKDDIKAENCLDIHQQPIYPMVKEVLGLKFETNEIRKSIDGKKMSDYMDFKEYIKEYCIWTSILIQE